MKTYKNHSEVCKAFLNQESVNGQATSLYFIKESLNLFTLYSYGRHYELAILFNDFVLVNNNSYSRSTEKHKSKLLSEATKLNIITFILKFEKNEFDINNLNSFIQVNKDYLQNLLDVQIKARKNTSYLKSFHYYLNTLNHFLEKIGHCNKFLKASDFTNYNEAVSKFSKLDLC